MDPAIPVLCICGPSAAGKTTFAAALVDHFRGRGRSPLTVASAEDQADFAEKTAGIEATVVSAASARGIDGAAALAYYRSLLKKA